MLDFIHKIFRTVAKVTLVIAVFIFIISVFTRSFSSSIKKTRNQQDLVKIYHDKTEKLYKEIEKKSPQSKLVLNSYRFMSCTIIGEGCFDKAGQQYSMLGRMASAATFTYTHPVSSGVQETYSTLANAGLAPKTYAAEGIGFSALRGFRTVWVVFRNIAYSVLVVVMVVVAFMIMFRMKMSAQAEIKIQSALPRIVFSLLLITFSYAIAGFLIDAMYVVMGLVISLLCNNDMYCNSSETINRYYNAGAGTIFTSFFPFQSKADAYHINGFTLANVPILGDFLSGIDNMWILANSLISILPPTIMGLLYIVGAVFNWMITSSALALANNVGVTSILSGLSAFTFSVGEAPKGIFGVTMGILIFAVGSFIIVPLIMMLLILMTIFYLFFRIFFMILMSYTQVLLYIIFAPAYMLLDAIPGKSGFSSWFKNLFGELMTFPLVSSLFVVGSLIVNNFQPEGSVSPSASPAWQPPFLSGIEQESFLLIVGMAIIFLIPDIVKMAKDSIGAKGMGMNFGWGSFFSGAVAGFGGATGLMGKGLGMMNTFGGPGTAKDFLSRHVNPVRDQLFRGRDMRGPGPDKADEKYSALGRSQKQAEIDDMFATAKTAKSKNQDLELAFKQKYSGTAKNDKGEEVEVYKQKLQEYKDYSAGPIKGTRARMDALKKAGDEKVQMVAKWREQIAADEAAKMAKGPSTTEQSPDTMTQATKTAADQLRQDKEAEEAAQAPTTTDPNVPIEDAPGPGRSDEGTPSEDRDSSGGGGAADFD